jgi:hypothetical protein
MLTRWLRRPSAPSNAERSSLFSRFALTWCGGPCWGWDELHVLILVGKRGEHTFSSRTGWTANLYQPVGYPSGSYCDPAPGNGHQGSTILFFHFRPFHLGVNIYCEELFANSSRDSFESSQQPTLSGDISLERARAQILPPCLPTPTRWTNNGRYLVVSVFQRRSQSRIQHPFGGTGESEHHGNVLIASST